MSISKSGVVDFEEDPKDGSACGLSPIRTLHDCLAGRRSRYVDRNGDSMRLCGGRGAISVGLLAASEASVEFWGGVRDFSWIAGICVWFCAKSGEFWGDSRGST